MRRWMLVWAAASALWITGLAVALEPFGAAADLRVFEADAALSPQPAGPADFYRPAEDVARDVVARQKRAVARGYVLPASRSLELFLALAVLPTAAALALVAGGVWAVEGAAPGRPSRARRRLRRTVADQNARR